MRVYLSSTSGDLKDARAAVARQIRGMKHEPVFMDEYSASTVSAVEKCLEDVVQCQLYVGLFAFRYGHIPNGCELSVTELEYRKAKECGHPTLIFMLDEDIEEWPIRLIDRGENGIRMERLRRDLLDQEGHTVCLFKSEKELLERMPQAIGEVIERIGAAVSPTTEPTISATDEGEIVGIVFQDPQSFQDREEEIEQLRDLLAKQAVKFVPVVGRSGTGKTALISRLCLEIERGEFRLGKTLGRMGVDGLVYFDCRGSQMEAGERLFHDLARLLTETDTEELVQCWSDAGRAYAEKFRTLFSKLRHGRYLLALDNFDDALGPRHTIDDECLRTFLDVCLATPHGLQIVATSGTSILLSEEAQHRMRSVPLDTGLPVDNAVALLRALDPVDELGLRDAPQELLETAADLCYGLPRALISVAAILSTDPALTLERLLEEKSLFTERVVENLIAEQYQRLKNDRRRVLEALAVFEKPVPAAAIIHLVGPFFSRVDVRECLRDLVHSHFVAVSRARGTYELQPLLREYAYSQIPDEADDYCKRACHRTAADYYETVRKPAEHRKTPEDIQPQLDEFSQRLSAGQADEAARLINAVDSDYLQIWGHYRTVIALREQLLEKLTDLELLQSNLGNLALVYRRTGRVRDAVPRFQRAIEFARQADNKSALAEWHCELGNTYADLVDMPQALEQYNVGIEIARENSDLPGETRLLGNIAVAHRQLGNLQDAIDFYERALDIDQRRAATASTEEERHAAFRMRATHVGNKGKSHLALGDCDAARDCFQEAIEFMREDHYTYAEAVFVSHLGEVALARELFPDAIKHFEKSIELLRETGETRSTSYMLEGLATAHHFLGDLSEARACYENCRQLDVPETNFRCDVLLGLIELKQGNQQAAKERLIRGIALCRELLEKTPHFYEAIYPCALAQLALGAHQEALGMYEEALNACNARGVVNGAVQELELLRRAASQTPGLDTARQLLEAASHNP